MFQNPFQKHFPPVSTRFALAFERLRQVVCLCTYQVCLLNKATDSFVQRNALFCVFHMRVFYFFPERCHLLLEWIQHLPHALAAFFFKFLCGNIQDFVGQVFKLYGKLFLHTGQFFIFVLKGRFGRSQLGPHIP